MQMCVVELRDRPGKPLFHLEHYIEGKYIKYNSNSGFVRDDNMRLTPQVRPLDGEGPCGCVVSAQRVLKPHGAVADLHPCRPHPGLLQSVTLLFCTRPPRPSATSRLSVLGIS